MPISRITSSPSKGETKALADLGLNENVFIQALLSGRAAYLDHTSDDCPSAKGFETLSRIIRSISEAIQSNELTGFVRTGSNQVVFVSDNTVEPFQFIVSSGNNMTGTKSGFPDVLNPRGSQTSEKIRANQVILGISDSALFPLTLDNLILPASTRCLTWILLYHICADGTIKSEFSLPSDFIEEGADHKIRIRAWERRIILDEIHPAGDIESVIKPPDSRMYDFEVRRKEETR